MKPALLVRLRPAGPWRYGPDDGGQDRVDLLYRSDRLYSALTIAMQQLGALDEWLDATGRTESPALTFSSLSPFQGDALLVPPPATLWPPPAALLTTPSPVFLTKVRWSAARFVPVALIESILTGQKVLADQWLPDPESGCLLRRDRPSSPPFRTIMRSGAAIDRLTYNAAAHSSACVEFEPGAGLWTVVRFRDEAAGSAWNDRLRAALRLLADTGFGARRRSGWGQTETPEFQEGAWPAVLFPKLARRIAAATNGSTSQLYWLLSLFSPAPSDSIDWKGGSYEVVARGGRIDSSGTEKKRVRMIVEGSVLSAAAEPVGSSVDVAPEGFPHAVYRFGAALFLQLPPIEESLEEAQVEPPADIEAPEPQPCPQPPEPPPDGTPTDEEGASSQEPPPAPEFEPGLQPEIELPPRPEPPREPAPEPEPTPEEEPGDEV